MMLSGNACFLLEEDGGDVGVEGLFGPGG